MKADANKTGSPAEIRNAVQMTPAQARYWNAKAIDLALRVNLVDPWRASLKTLREEYEKGTKVYLASTGGKWGKSAQIVTL